MSNPFQLKNETPKPKPRSFTTTEAKQTVLFSGMDCLPGQKDLFQTDGKDTQDDEGNAISESDPSGHGKEDE